MAFGEGGEDWPSFLGPRRDGKSRETGILLDWPETGPPLVWTRVVGEGYSMPSVAGGRLYHFDREGDEVRLTNARWRVAIRDLNAAFGFDPVILVNDFAAIAWAVPRLAAPDLVKIGGGRPVARAPAAVIGPGTGLGMAGIVSINGQRWVLETEGGHATMAAADDRESALLDRLRRRHGHVSVERVVSGGGLVNLYQALAEARGSPAPARTPAEITHEALAGSCPVSLEALNTFCAMLGTAAGNLALTLGARGGVFLAGGIVPRMVPFFAASAFRSRFEAKGRYRDYLTAIPTWVIVHPDPGFLGLLSLLERGRQGAP